MPTYGYECKSCGHTFDVFQSMSDEAVKVCPECGREVRRLINGGTGIIFKGSGFYVTDKGKSGSGKGRQPVEASKPLDKTAPASPSPKETPASTSPGDSKPASTPAASVSTP
jgi:putative FmdB family regulatory protein